MANGHELIALANLCPLKSNSDEMDSFMYQTVGHSLVPAIAECLQLPLIRNRISGTARQVNKLYSVDNADEVEDLFKLLSRVKSDYPSVEGVAVGAILSNYQRVRVENVCSRLNLSCFAYLWRYDQMDLLREMRDCHLHAYLVKVAGIGLKKSFLGQELSSLVDILKKLHDMYGLNPAGEGGEYETIVLCAPIFKKRIVIDKFSIVSESDDSICPVAFMTNVDYHLEEKEDWEERLAEESFEIIRRNHSLSMTIASNKRHETKSQCVEQEISNSCRTDAVPTIIRSQYFSSIVGVRNSNSVGSFSMQSIEVLDKLMQLLRTIDCTFDNVMMTNIYIRSMKDFGEFNSIYSKYYGKNHPSARACVASYLPDGVNVEMEAIVSNSDCPLNRQVMHVQSISYWAPANIGPYSQSVVMKSFDNCGLSRMFMAGQIGLIPGIMEMPNSIDLQTEAEISLDNAILAINAAAYDKTSKELLNPSELCISGFTCFIGGAVGDSLVSTAIKQLEQKSRQSGIIWPGLYVQVKQLPRYALFEWLLYPVINSCPDGHFLLSNEEISQCWRSSSVSYCGETQSNNQTLLKLISFDKAQHEDSIARVIDNEMENGRNNGLYFGQLYLAKDAWEMRFELRYPVSIVFATELWTHSGDSTRAALILHYYTQKII